MSLSKHLKTTFAGKPKYESDMPKMNSKYFHANRNDGNMHHILEFSYVRFH